jgi:hypothetical protein
LGHASVQTTERYLGTKQDLVHAPNDARATVQLLAVAARVGNCAEKSSKCARV